MYSSVVAVANLRNKLTELRHLGSVASLLAWDQQVNVPSKGNEARAELIAYVSGLIHKNFTSSEFEDVLMNAKLAMDSDLLNEDQACIVRETLNDFIKSKKLSAQFVEEMAFICAQAHDFWVRARKASDFKLFAPHLKKIVEFKREEAKLIGYIASPYDALLDDYEPGLSSMQVQEILAEVKDFIISLVAKIKDSRVYIDRTFLKGSWPIEQQKYFAKMVISKLGFDLEAGHMSISPHPFCDSLHPTDTRITVRYRETDFVEQCLMSAIHEAGHGMYEQGLPVEYFGTPRGEAASLGIHEFNSRLWENIVGRSKFFWGYFYPELKSYFSNVLLGVSLGDFYKAINYVEPSLIRTDADEVTYNLHVLFRFEIEKDLIEGRIEVDDLPSIWNQKVRDYLGIEVDDDANGVLQDTHWADGSFGYFPTYTLGNLYAAQFYAKAIRDLPERLAPEDFFRQLLNWLRENVHGKGKLYGATELVERVTGERPTARYFKEYITNKYSEIYNL